jgi:LacI family transcriptional regulator
MTRVSSLRIDPRSDVGIAVQIANGLALLVADGNLGPGDRLPSVRELAAQLGVTVNTVRAAYARLEADGVIETRHGVGSTVASPGREWAPLGRSLGTDAVAVLIGGLDPFYLPLVRGIEDVAAELGLLVLMVDTHDDTGLADAMVRRLVARGVTGIIAVSVGGAPEALDGARAQPSRGPRMVYVDQPDRPAPSIIFDARAAGIGAVGHLASHGHRRIGFVTAPLAWANVRDLHDGYVEGLAAVGIAAEPSLVAEVAGFDLDQGRRGASRLLDAPDRPTAILAGGEMLSHGVLAEARARGVAIPDGLALVGYTDSPSSALVDPPLTMVEVPSRRAGEQAMRALAELLAGHPVPAERTVLDVALITRRSCGCG